MLYQLLESKEPQERQVGQVITGMEYENLVTALNLALAAQVSILNPYSAVSSYLDKTQDQHRGLELGQTVLSRLEAYSTEKLAGQLGAEFVGVIDDIANRQDLLKQHAAAEESYQKALAIWLENKSYDTDTIRKRSASTYHQLGMVAEEQRQWQQAREYFLKALEIFVEYKDTYSGGVVLRSLAPLWKASGDASIPAAVATTLGASLEETENLLREMLGEE
jgi:tetratricopeptide (TPR) repeat protein